MSRERPLTHERPHTHNPRDPHKVPAREQAHASPKSIRSNSIVGIVSSNSSGGGGGGGGGEGGDKEGVGGAGCGGSSVGDGGEASRDSCSFPSLPMSLAAWGAPAFGGVGGGVGGGFGGGGGGVGGRSGSIKQGLDVITMTKPRDVLVEGLLR